MFCDVVQNYFFVSRVLQVEMRSVEHLYGEIS